MFFHLMICNIFIPFNTLCSIYFKCSSIVMVLPIQIPRYLYLSTTGIPSMSSLYSLGSGPCLVWNIIPDFFLFNFILFLASHLSVAVIAFFNSVFPTPIIARSSAYANVSSFFSLSSLIRSLNIIRNSVGDSTPPCITPLFISTVSFPTLNFV